MELLKRKIDDYLVNWKKNSERNPLIVKGARQIGKTASIRHFAENNYKNIIYTDLNSESTCFENRQLQKLLDFIICKVDECIKYS